MLLNGQAKTFVVVSLTLIGIAGCSSAPPSPNAGASVPEPVTPTKVTVGNEVSAVARNKVEVTFPSGGIILTPDANRQLDIAARLFRDANPVFMFTTGYSDRSGDEYYNLILSAKRAEAVKRGLVARGIPADRLLIQALGESEQVNTSDPVSPENRRVVITWRLL